MGETSKIEWTEATYNPIRARNRVTGAVGWHCSHVSPGCEHCYAENINRRRGTGLPFKPGHLKDVDIFLDERMLFEPLKWKRPRKIFVCSMTDLFADFVPDDMIDRIFGVMALADHHEFQVLTKRSARMLRYFQGIEEGGQFHEGYRDALIEGAAQSIYAQRNPGADPSMWLAVHLPLPNVQIGVSVEDQERANERLPDLLESLAAKRFVSYEPALGLIDFTSIDDGAAHREVPAEEWGPVDHDESPPSLWWDTLTGKRTIMHGGSSGEWSRIDASIDQIIVGGESGQGARPFDLAWARSTIRQCKDAGVAVFIKQLGRKPVSNGQRVELQSPKGGDMDEWSKDLRVREFPGEKA